MKTRKKIAAAMAAVTNYIKTEEEQLAMQAAIPLQRPTPISFWGQSARQNVMQMRTLMQFRSFKGSAFR
ncbi:MAG: hypothetical protein PHP23_12650 [Desulfobacterales bacterium]|nr:hypothetical protein [Desulfobacterales bacterium]MDD4070884.1 hypothetical protein [Desulfobacterales bacterium]MDD4392891.1 hypothetical protein [Desulfobacterales bacterium]